MMPVTLLTEQVSIRASGFSTYSPSCFADTAGLGYSLHSLDDLNAVQALGFVPPVNQAADSGVLQQLKYRPCSHYQMSTNKRHVPKEVGAFLMALKELSTDGQMPICLPHHRFKYRLNKE